MKASRVLALCSLALLAAAANAQTSVTASIGTGGLGVHVGIPVAKTINARFGVNSMEYDKSGNTSSVDYDFKLKMLTADALVDWFPTSTGFRLTGGVSYNGTKMDANARPNIAGSYTINGRTYTAADVGSLTSKVDFRDFAPYLGLGWGTGRAEKGWAVDADVGVMFQGAPRSNLASSGCTASAVICQRLADDIAAENESLRDKLKDFRYLPVVRLGATYRF